MKRRGFTLVELLVIIAIIAVLIGLILPAVQKVREAASRAHCSNNLRQLGVALQQYHDGHRGYPPGLTVKGTDNLEMGGYGGFVLLLPYLEQANVIRQWDRTRNWYDAPNDGVVSTEIRVFYCPSNRDSGVIDMSFLVPAAGRPLPNPAACDYLLCKGANAGMCEVVQLPPGGRGVFDINSKTRIGDIRDGVSNTFAIGEGAGGNSRFGIRHFYADTAPAALFPGQSRFIDQSWYSGPSATNALHSIGLLEGCTMGVTALRGGHNPPFDEPMNSPLVLPALDFNNGCVNLGTTPGSYDMISGFRSMHQGGCYFLFCDGSVRFVEQGIAPGVYRALSTIAGGETVGDF